MILQDLTDRHAHGDWGGLHEEARTANERALLQGKRLWSAYNLPTGKTVLVITERDRWRTTTMLQTQH
jgi:hypothetical protein